jgi:hypothetical protein
MARVSVTVWVGAGYTYWQKALAWFTKRGAR